MLRCRSLFRRCRSCIRFCLTAFHFFAIFSCTFFALHSSLLSHTQQIRNSGSSFCWRHSGPLWYAAPHPPSNNSNKTLWKFEQQFPIEYLASNWSCKEDIMESITWLTLLTSTNWSSTHNGSKLLYKKSSWSKPIITQLQRHQDLEQCSSTLEPYFLLVLHFSSKNRAFSWTKGPHWKEMGQCW